jgi:hypothetical protein
MIKLSQLVEEWERDYRSEYKNFQGTSEQKKRRAGRNRTRKKLEKLGLVHKGDGKDIHHKDENPENNRLTNLRIEHPSRNRSRK